ncbi:MAG: UDP-2,3-diacylglucosamine diphosphatase [Bacteroidales bacterium]|nr:UDP-2,3-diacylglucosamine diphosphatase [Bacteroidales bacterium]
MKNKKRRLELVVLSDIHLGTPGCQANELLSYLRSIKPKSVILNGDIIDIWQFKKRFWPKSHMKIVKHLITMSTKGTHIYYITGNHDETIRKFSGTQLGNIKILNQLSLNLDGHKFWFFHGDVFDVTMQYSKWLARLGSIGYDLLIQLNILINYFRKLLGRKKISLSKRIKDNVKSAVKYINNFEVTAAQLAASKGYHAIVCGHIHNPEIRTIRVNQRQEIKYLNSGDWIENLSALEYSDGKWELYLHDVHQLHAIPEPDESTTNIMELNNKELFKIMLKEFQN